MFAKADTLIDKIWSCPRIKLSNSQTLILDDVETGVLLSDIAQHPRLRNTDVPDIYSNLLALLVYLQLWFWIKMPQPERKEAWFLSKYELQKLQRLHTQGGAAYRSVCILVKASNLSVSNVRQIMLSKPCYTKFTLVTRNIKRMKAFARFKNEIWCMDLAYFDKLARDNNGVMYFLVPQDLNDRTVDAKGLKRKDSKETVLAILTIITNNSLPKKNFGRQVNRICCRA